MHQPHVAQPVVVYKLNKIPSESSFEFSLSLCPKSIESYCPPSSAAISHLATKLFFYGFSVVDLRVISLELESFLSAARTLNLALHADRSVKRFSFTAHLGFVVFTRHSF